jgi:hypothetical protein
MISSSQRPLPDNTQNSQQTTHPCPLVGFEPTISAGEQPQAHRAWIFVCCECRVLSGRGLCNELIICPEESYRLCCVVVCDLETSRICTPYIYEISHLRVKETEWVCVGRISPSIRANGGIFLTQQWALGFHKIRRIQLLETLLLCERWLCSIEKIRQLCIFHMSLSHIYFLSFLISLDWINFIIIGEK